MNRTGTIRRVVGDRGALRALLVGAAVFALGAAPIALAQPSPYTSLHLYWTAPGDDGDVGQVSGYDIRYAANAPAGTDTTTWWNGIPTSQRLALSGSLAASGQTDSTLVTGLTQGTTYYFLLVAMDEVGNRSGYSNIAVGTTQSCGAPASAPGSFAAVADTGQVLVSWAATGDPAALSLRLYRALGASGSFSLLQTLPVSSTSYLDTAVQPGTTYRYRATWAAADVGGTTCEGPSSTTPPVTTPGNPPSGTSPTATPAPTIHAYPNPSSAGVNVSLVVTGQATQSVLLRLFDMSGRWIATVAEGNYPPGTHLIAWNRSGRNGERVAPGYYELLGTVGETRVRERLVLLP